MTCAPPSLLPGAAKHCPDCDQSLPLTSFSLNRHGNPRPQCRPCRSKRESARYAAKATAEIERRRAAQPAWKRAHRERLHRDREARKTAAAYERAERETSGMKVCGGCQTAVPLDRFPRKGSGKRHNLCRPCHSAEARQRYHRKLGRTTSGAPRGTISPERRRELEERTNRLVGLLMGTADGERIETQEGWETVVAELHKLWRQGGARECVSCKEAVLPERMHPPGPANSRPHHCHPCADRDYLSASLDTYGALPTPRPIPLRDGSTITIGQLAGQHRAREAGCWSRHPSD